MGPQGMAKRKVNFTIDEELVEALALSSARRRESMSLIVREALRSQLSSELAAVA